ncbi:hypothetical protein RHSIM_Rhsim08G0083100 [Rhododendron simsii]|uniref:Transposase n=1 Tax=Rhododendron simsii TaxID=118357 RepID=A0A834LHY8_RHOSS|nr:hypothetical protein RHSIM_Rhsim08G0083100 [Rhododendron simsii]
MDPIFDFYLGGELEDDEVDAKEVELGGNANPPVSTNADIVDVQDDTVVEVGEKRLKTKLPPQVPQPKKERYRSPTWDHFNEIKVGGVTKWAEYKYCKKQYRAESKKHGVSNLKAHIPVCPLYPNRDQHGQQNLSFKPTDGGDVDVVTHIFSFDDCKRALAEMVIIDELPFRFVEGIGFRKFYNASSNDTAIKFLKRKTKDWKQTILDHDYLHVRCCAHILNLIVVEGLKDRNESILRVRDVVRYVRSSPQRWRVLRSVWRRRKLFRTKLCLDVCTWWNSIYFMLEVAVKFEKAFQRMVEEDSGFKTFFGIKEGDNGELVSFEGGETIELVNEGGQARSHRVQRIPTKLGWKNCTMFSKFLKLFYDATKKSSTSLFVTSNVFFDEMYNVEVQTEKLIANNDPLLSKMAFEMKKKFDTYWGKGDKFNFLLYVAVVLDCRFKLRWVKFCYIKTKGKEVAEQMEKRVKGVLEKLYDAYANEGEVRVQVASATLSVVVDEDCDDRLSLASEFDTYLEQEYSSVCSSEVDKYVNDLCERKDIPDFDILLWWKNNSNKYPILSQLARDVLAMPVSTVASESAFSTGGCVLDPFRSSLSPSMVETLVCTQNWLLSTVPISLRQAMDKVEDLEREILGNDASSEVPKD